MSEVKYCPYTSCHRHKSHEMTDVENIMSCSLVYGCRASHTELRLHGEILMLKASNQLLLERLDERSK